MADVFLEPQYIPPMESLIAAQIGWLVIEQDITCVTIAPAQSIFTFRDDTPVSVSIHADKVETFWESKTMTVHVTALPLISQLEAWVANWGISEKLYEIEEIRAETAKKSMFSKMKDRLASIFTG
jgi:hypothetical protein